MYGVREKEKSEGNRGADEVETDDVNGGVCGTAGGRWTYLAPRKMSSCCGAQRGLRDDLTESEVPLEIQAKVSGPGLLAGLGRVGQLYRQER